LITPNKLSILYKNNANMSDDLTSATQQSLQALNAQRQAMESEAQAITNELTETPANTDGDGGPGLPMGIDTPLVDSDGFPRADIDVYRARSLRARLAEIRSDLQNLMKEIESHLQKLAVLRNPAKKEETQQEYAARMRPKPKPRMDPKTGKWVVANWDGTIAGVPDGDQRRFDSLEDEVVSSATDEMATPATTDPAARAPQRVTSAPTLSDDHQNLQELKPFARINAVAVDSPAAEAGLLENDLVLQFGNITMASAVSPMNEVAELVPVAAGNRETIPVRIQRGGRSGGNTEASIEMLELALTPRPWAGRGVVGCHIVPYVETEGNSYSSE
jgi:hypothetical protein